MEEDQKTSQLLLKNSATLAQASKTELNTPTLVKSDKHGRSQVSFDENIANQQTQLNIYSKQLDFFVFENHMRNTMYTIIEPLTLKISEQKIQIDLLKKDLGKSQDALSHVEEVVLNKQRKNMPTIFDQLYNKIADMASESHERDEDLRKRIDILQIRANKSEDNILTLLSQNQRIENHIRIALKDVSVVQQDVAQFKEMVETKLKEETDNIAQKWAQIKLSNKQTTDLVNDLQKQQNFAQDDINRHYGILTSQQTHLEAINRRITKIEQIKLDENIFYENSKQLDERLKSLRNLASDIQNNLKSTDNYLEKYLPFNTFCQLFEVLRLTLDPNLINRVKDYEEYRLKELYDVILTDTGEAKTSFNKKYVINPVGYELDTLATQEARLQSKSKRFIMGRPSLSSSVKLNEKGEPISEPPPKNSYYGFGAKFQQQSKKEKRMREREKERERQRNNKKKQLGFGAELDELSPLDMPNLQLKRNSKSMKVPRLDPTKDRGNSRPGLGALIEDPKGEDMSQLSLEDDDDEEEEIDEQMNDAIEDLKSDGKHARGEQQSRHKEPRLLEAEVVRPRDRALSAEDRQQGEAHGGGIQKRERPLHARLQHPPEVEGHHQAFSLKIDGFNKILKHFEEKTGNALKKFSHQLEKLQNMYNYLHRTIEQQGGQGRDLQSRSKSSQSNTQTVFQQQNNQKTHMSIRNYQTEIKSRNLNSSSAAISNFDNQAFRSTQLTNASTKIGNYPNMGVGLAGIEQLHAFNHSTLFIKGGAKPIIQENGGGTSLSRTFMKGMEDKGDFHSSLTQSKEENRPQTAIIKSLSAHKGNKRMIIIPSNQNLGNQPMLRDSNNHAATSTHMMGDPSNTTSIIL